MSEPTSSELRDREWRLEYEVAAAIESDDIDIMERMLRRVGHGPLATRLRNAIGDRKRALENAYRP